VRKQFHGVSEWWLFARVFLFAAAVPLIFRLRITWLNRLLSTRRGAVRPAGELCERELILRCVEWAIRAGNPVIRQNCLTRGVTRYYFLRRAGADLSLCFGAAWHQGEFLQAPGHCWLVENGKPCLEESDPLLRFVPIYSLPQAGSPARENR
jgi:hypothetical protein